MGSVVEDLLTVYRVSSVQSLCFHRFYILETFFFFLVAIAAEINLLKIPPNCQAFGSNKYFYSEN